MNMQRVHYYIPYPSWPLAGLHGTGSSLLFAPPKISPRLLKSHFPSISSPPLYLSPKKKKKKNTPKAQKKKKTIFRSPHSSPILISSRGVRSKFKSPQEKKMAKPIILLLFILSSSAAAAAATLTEEYYSKSCPDMQQIVSDVVMDKQLSAQTTAAGTLRLFFHDCFVGGCDASVLVSTNSFSKAERDADINLSLPGDAFDAVVRAKTKLELRCPGVVSCSDILAVAARDLLIMLGGPFYRVPLGRKDSLTSADQATVDRQMPLPNMTVPAIVDRFAAKGFTVREMVALSGAHTVGFSHCKEFADRIFDFNGKGPKSFDPTMNPRFAAALQSACANYRKDPTMATFNDIMTPGKFDNLYYQNLQKGLGLLKSDQELASDPRTAPIVAEYARDEKLFFKDFAAAMEKLGLHGVKTERDGEVRRRCDVFNNLKA